MDFPQDIFIKNELKLTIDKAYPSDALEIVNFLNKVAGQTDFLTFALNSFPFSVEEEKNIIKECLDTNNCLMLLGKINKEVVSQLFLQRSSQQRLLHNGDIAISVCESYWGNSIAQNILLLAIKWAKDHAITKLQLQVRTDNKKAIYLYQKLGFCIEGTITRAIKINDTYFSDYIMGLSL